MSVLGMFYWWAMAEQYATAVPFTYQQAVMLYAETVREVLVNQARRRVPKAHVTIKYLEDDFATLSRPFSRSRVSKTSTPCSWAATIQSRRVRAYVPHEDGAGQFSVGRSRNHSFATAVARTPWPSSNRRSSSTRNAIPRGSSASRQPQDSQPSLD